MNERVKVTVTVEKGRLQTLLNTLEEMNIPWVMIKPERKAVSVEVADAAYQLAERGHVVRDISRRTGLSKSTVSRITRNPKKYGLSRKPLRREEDQ